MSAVAVLFPFPSHTWRKKRRALSSGLFDGFDAHPLEALGMTEKHERTRRARVFLYAQ
jgi:hypothetical protein